MLLLTSGMESTTPFALCVSASKIEKSQAKMEKCSEFRNFVNKKKKKIEKCSHYNTPHMDAPMQINNVAHFTFGNTVFILFI